MSDQDLFQRPILLYSEFCLHSKDFLKELIKFPHVYDAFIRLSIDVDADTNQRPYLFYLIQQRLDTPVSAVPSIIIEEGKYLLTGTEAFQWLDYISKNSGKEPGSSPSIDGFSPLEMGSFSDQYAAYGSTGLNDASEQTFHFITNAHQRIDTPPESSTVQPEDVKKKQFERDHSLSFSAPSAKGSPPSFTRTLPKNTSQSSNKVQDMDAKLEQLLKEREASVPPPSNPFRPRA